MNKKIYNNKKWKSARNLSYNGNWKNIISENTTYETKRTRGD